MADTNKTPTLEQEVEALKDAVDTILIKAQALGLRERILKAIVERDEAKEGE